MRDVTNLILSPICSMVLEYLPTCARTKSPSHVGFYIPAPWVAYGSLGVSEDLFFQG